MLIVLQILYTYCLMNWIGFDYGKRFIGVAIGNTVTKLASPIDGISARRGVPDWEMIDRLVKEWQPAGFIVGFPTQLDGSEQKIAQHVRLFRKNLKNRYQLPCVLVCEQLSSHAARGQLPPNRSKSDIDAAAATIILQQWFDEDMPDESLMD